MSLIVKTFPVSHFEQNARILLNPEEKKAMIIDPGAEEKQLFDATLEYDVDTIFLTHCHLDHAGAAKRLLSLFDAHNKKRPQLLYHSNEIIVAEHIEAISQSYGLPENCYENAPKPDRNIDQLKTLSLGSETLTLLFTPGHSPGHFAVYYDKDNFSLEGAFSDTHNCKQLLIAGDTLFAGSIGRTDLPMGNHEQLITSIQTQLFTLPEDTLVCPGHGPNTTIGHEKEHNPFF